ncbi:adenosylcobalamin-dependent ribonucleoside-diphosphate reductase [Prevotella amnii]|uniref:adenosylcobalamin-dependent ribonucleoside-diphosphate reductase n=1 Tax=Prevotella amnii TaxID=419005 RepID=UPI00036EB3D8|nr:adenosylcobalamin-dependent ribonucleoside-diphosphate reductase [Prevotella amnii]
METCKIYSYEEVLESALNYFGNDEIAAKVWIDNYALKDSLGNLYEKSPEDMHWRIANEVARIEKRYVNPINAAKVFEVLDHFRYIVPSGSSMVGIGNKYLLSSLANCFVIGSAEDVHSYGTIMHIDEEQVQLMKRSGIVGHDLSYIRPKGSSIKDSKLISTGILPFMERYFNSMREVVQGGHSGALMLSVNIKHPDVESLIDVNIKKAKDNSANISVKITDEFMKAVINEESYIQQFPIISTKPIFTKEIYAKHLFEKILYKAYHDAEPTVLFWDNILKDSLSDCYADLGFQTISITPYYKIPLSPYDSCHLLSLNLYSYVIDPFTKEARFDFDKFAEHVQIAQRVLDDIVDLELEKIDLILSNIEKASVSKEIKETEYNLWKKIKEKSAMGRRIGIGVTAEGDMFAAMGLCYGTQESIDFSVKVHKVMALNAYRSSVNMAKERGSFAIYDAIREKNNPFILRLKREDEQLFNDMERYGRRNIACLAIASIKTVSLMTQTTSGIEPKYIPVYKHRDNDKINSYNKNTNTNTDLAYELDNSFREHIIYHSKFLTWMKVNGIEPTKKYSQEEIDDLIKRSPYYMTTANYESLSMIIHMQGAIEKWTDQSVSVTINMPSSIDEESISKLYFEAWRCGCKGCSIISHKGLFADMKTYLLKDNDNKDNVKRVDKQINLYEENHDMPFQRPEVVEHRPKELDCDVVRFQNNKEKWVAFVGLLNGYPYEIFTGLQDDEEGIALPKSVTKGKIIKQTEENGQHRYDFQFENKRGYKTTVEGLSEKFNPEYWNYAKLISGVLRYRMPIEHVMRLVASLQLKDESINTWKNGVERALKKYLVDGTKVNGLKCPICGEESLIYQGGNLICKHCGASRGI